MTLYLKYRPKDFESLVWQNFIKNTLRQAIIKDKLVGAYLFCWPRGTGKTSTARIFAKAINCTNIKDGNPCSQCEICLWVQNENLVDIVEIDAASYTWVDNIREIIEKAVFSPTTCKYKVYIIDEVHMLSKWAFNALLKILEEPPEHLKFILATTESHKIPETILSRCQRYDFKSISNDDLKQRLLYIAKEENINIDEESLEFITKQANGWLRNAISLFEQLVMNWEIKFESVIQNYGIPRNEVLISFYEKLIAQDTTIISDFDSIASEYNLQLFFKELLFFIKDKLLEKMDSLEEVKKHIFLLENLEEAYLKSKNSFDGKTIFLVGIIKSIKNITFTSNDIPPAIQTTKKVPQETTQASKESVPEIKKVSTKEISHDDLFDVFWEESFWDVMPDTPNSFDNIEVPQITKENKPNLPVSNFNQEWFIQALRNLWGKWALTMSLRASTLQFDEKNLIVFTKTKIAMKQISSSDNISLMSRGLETMWFLNINIEIK